MTQEPTVSYSIWSIRSVLLDIKLALVICFLLLRLTNVYSVTYELRYIQCPCACSLYLNQWWKWIKLCHIASAFLRCLVYCAHMKCIEKGLYNILDYEHTGSPFHWPKTKAPLTQVNFTMPSLCLQPLLRVKYQPFHCSPVLPLNQQGTASPIKVKVFHVHRRNITHITPLLLCLSQLTHHKLLF